ncbi:unnamed protein product [Vitrella brassicaformis CCMP3155]|uniref:Rad50/SbcC-type AAA domain-containing protein n=2 Tax=Vitrella brassicaformis TaxID=1169539 RepID=A0A0G4F4Y7_VITBC|nr:unnamed protein product [Vitrella brassicaformis CCMP3155]|eukprot:CEM06880.1 unnamed protein product [Vitrella brassicaformis CCMP3155]
MTTLEKLGVQGIRSFDPESLQTIKFEKPLTLIVGPNGAGKTTLIESLKMITSGELPPNANKGQTFIHDPKLTNSPEVRAQIRLVFRTVDGKQIGACRKFQLTNTKDKNGRLKTSYKQLESVLQTQDPRTNEKKSVSHRCADMDAQVPLVMGISKAILENVIFCHQEDSDWPLQDMGKLKKKFDDLFGATRYTKALAKIKDIRTAQAKELRELNEGVIKTESARNQAVKYRKQVAECEEQLAKQTALIETLEAEIAAANDAVKQATERLRADEDLGTEVERLEAQKKSIEDQIVEVENDMVEELEGTLEEVKDMVQSMEQGGLEAVRQNENKAERAYNEGEQLRKKLTDEWDKKRNAHGALGAAASVVEQFKGDREKMLAALKELEPVSQYPSQSLGDDMGALNALLQTRKEAVERAMREMNDKETELKSSIDNVEKNRTRLHMEVSTCKAQYDSCIKSIQETESQIRKLAVTGEDLSQLRASIAKQKSSIRQSQDNAILGETAREVDELAFKKQEVAQRIRKADETVRYLEAQSKQINEVDFMRKNLQKTEDTLSDKFSDLRQPMVELLGSEPDPHAAGEVVQKEMRNLRDDLAAKNRAFNELQKSHAEHNARRTVMEEDVNQLSQKLKEQLRLMGEDSSAAAATSLEKKVEDATKQLAAAEEKAGLGIAAPKFYHKALQASKDKGKCVLCQRPFSKNEDERKVEIEELEKSIKGRLENITTQAKASEEAIKKVKGELADLEKQRPLLERIKALQRELPTKENGLQQLNKEVTKAHEALQAAETEKRVADERLAKLQHLQQDVTQLQTLAQDIKEQKRLLEEKQGALMLQGGGAADTDALEDARKNLAALHKELDTVTSEEDEARTRKQLADQMAQKGKMKLTQLEKDLATAESQYEVKMELESALRTKREEVKKLQEKQTLAQKKLDEVQSRLDQLQRDKDDKVKQAKKKVESSEQQHRSLKQRVDDLRSIETQLAKKQEEVANAQTIADEVSAAERARNAQEKKVEDLRAALKQARDNRLKEENDYGVAKKQVKVATLRSALDKKEKELEAKRQRLGGRNLAEKRAEVDRLTKERDEKRQKKSFEEGSTKTIRAQMDRVKADLKQEQYKDIDQKYLDIVLKHQTLKMANDDLQKYYTALDKALMKYHAMKMQEINKTIRELWQSVYKGPDIDSVAVRSDTDEDAPASTGQRSYNYRVVMLKGGQELEMRGRCSAGQKVLASLVIRLALAESFGANCGILALDEPTTNLDRYNIEGLAKALAGLIEARRDNANFQLILITHDEEFVRLLARHQPCDHFWQIHKNSKGHSVITQADIRRF